MGRANLLKGDLMKRKTIYFLLLLLLLLLLLWLLFWRPGDRPSTLLLNASGEVTREFQLHDSLLLAVEDLSADTGYDIRVFDEDGQIVAEAVLSTDLEGRIPETLLWYGIGVRTCDEAVAATADEDAAIPYSLLVDFRSAGRSFTLEILEGGEVVRTAEFRVSESPDRPVLYAADSRGCPKTGFLIGEEDVWVVGRNFPRNAAIRLWTAPASAEWLDGEALVDETKQYDAEPPPLFELRGGETGFLRKLWPRSLTARGSFDIVAEVLSYPAGTFRARAQVELRSWVSSHRYSGFVVQRRPGVAEPLEMDIAGTVQSPLTYRDTFLPGEPVYVGVDPAIQPDYLQKTAHVYIVKDRTESEWQANPDLFDSTGQTLDVTGTVETITIYGVCGNCWKTLAWSNPTEGKYDVVLDFDNDKKYTSKDLIDSLEPPGFTVSKLRVESISFNYTGSGAVTIYDDKEKQDIAAPEYSPAVLKPRPAAWVVGGPHTVQVQFAAVSSVSQAKIWAESGLGGLASSAAPVQVSFAGGQGQATFTANNAPVAVAMSDFYWKWKHKDLNGATTPAEEIGWTGEHRLYTVLATPKKPQVEPWLGTLEIAAKAANGKTTVSAAAQAIWHDFYQNAGGKYDVNAGDPNYSSHVYGLVPKLNLTKWLANYPTVGTVNCSDMAYAIAVFVNALGGSAEPLYIGNFGYLNAVKPVGRGWTNNPFYEDSSCSYPNPPAFCGKPIVNGDASFPNRTSFAYHAVTRLNGQLFDGSGGQVDTDGDPDYGPPFQARQLDGNDSWTNEYKDRVIDDVPPSNPDPPSVAPTPLDVF